MLFFLKKKKSLCYTYTPKCNTIHFINMANYRISAGLMSSCSVHTHSTIPKYQKSHFIVFKTVYLETDWQGMSISWKYQQNTLVYKWFFLQPKWIHMYLFINIHYVTSNMKTLIFTDWLSSYVIFLIKCAALFWKGRYPRGLHVGL